ncbi:hypothetical protein LAZ67_4003902, partial [Cordylochernes scorpioides]
MAQIQPPETFDFSTPNEWPKWRRRFERYLVVSGMKKKEEADKIDLFMYLMGDRADDIFRTFKFEKEEEATKIDSVLKAFDSHFCVRKNIIYERAKFNSRIQEDREPVDEFITSLYKLADSCEFEGLHEQLIRDRIVVGVRDKALSERMQLDSELTLEKAVKMVRQQEAVRQQQVDLQRPSTSQKVNQVKFNSKKQSPKQQQQPSRKKEKSAKTRSRCPKCGGFTHKEGQACRAEGQRCNLCSKTGHFANCCPDKQAKTAEVKAVSELDEEIGFLLEVSAVEDSSNLDNDEDECRRRWTAEIQVNGKKEKIYVIRRLSEPLLSRRACEILNLARRIEVVATRINPIKEFPEVFEGLGQIGNPYEIKLKPGAKPYAVHTPRRVPIPLMEKLKTRLEKLDKDDILTKIFEAQQEDTNLKAVVNYLEQGWPDKKKMSQALLSYWHVKDELGVQNGLLMRSCRLVIPASMKLEILDKLHAGHFGITKTRLRARETVWWPGISEEIAETVRKCSVCIQEAVSKHEPLIPTNFPTRPWQKIGMDLFKFENKWYLVVIDYYSRFPEVVQLDRLTANVVVRSCKSIFARHGIPETVVSDNGTQFGAAREFANFARQYGFTHVTSSPRFPQSNGMAEAGVKIAKLLLKKNQDLSLGLLEYRSTPLENGYSPAELLMGRKLRTTLPIAPDNLNPKLVDSQTLKRKEGRRRKDMKSRYDRRCGATDMEELSEGDTVWITDMRTWGIVKKKVSTPRSYMVDTPVGTLRRNRFHLRKGVTVQYPADPSTPTFSGEELVENEKTPVVDYPSNDSEDGQIRTRSGRIVKPLYRSVVDSLRIDIGRAYLWSDSQISLSWIKSDPNRWKTFIHNRVVKIQQLSDRNSWRHVSGKDNPADCASRGIMPAALSGHTLWWQGPTWLKDNNFVQNQDNCYGRECHEEEKVALACQSRVSVCPEIVTKYSTFIKTRRIIAWCLRFITNCRVSLKKREIGTLSKKELENAVIRIIGWIQKDEFGEEMQDLRNTGHASRKSRILQLNPFIDASGMLRVGGRIKYANVNPDQKFPLLLPKNHHFTKLIILHFHTRYLHAGPQLVLSLIRNSYWIMGGRDIVRRIIKQCITCFRFRAKTAVQIMGNLPADRVNPSRPFTKTGVDLAGPYELKPSLTRSKGTIKCYVILFVCFSVKAIHLEMVTSLSTSSFIAALRRFISRRGKPSKIYSDNGTNFRGTESFMKKQYKIMNSKETKDFLAEELIEWHFIPPSAPHFGGLWEANIKCLKGHLSKVIKSSLLNSEEFITLLCQVEACLNSRPLVELSPDPNDLRALTPGHFLIGSPLIEDPGLQNYERVDLRSRWNLVQSLRNSFWSRWTREYINSLQQRNKWRLSQDNLKPNQLVLIKEDNLPPLQWRLARILKVYPGSDQKVRVAQVRAATGVYLRPITKLAPLPFKSEPGFSGRGEMKAYHAPVKTYPVGDRNPQDKINDVINDEDHWVHPTYPIYSPRPVEPEEPQGTTIIRSPLGIVNGMIDNNVGGLEVRRLTRVKKPTG